MSNEESVASPEDQIREHFNQLQAEGKRIREAAKRKQSPSVVLAMQAMQAGGNLRTLLREIVFADEVSNEQWAAWALEHLSPHTDALTLAEANLTVVRHNIKTLFRMEGF